MWDELPVIAEADVVIVGSGSAGSSAAVAAGRSGADVVLIEKLPFLGGTSTAVLDTFYGFFTPGSVSKKVVGGVGDDVITELEALGPVVRRPNTFGAGMGITYVAEHLTVVWARLVREAGVRVLLHTFLQHAIVRNGWVDEIVVATKAGLRRVRAQVFVDASGDADLCHFAGFGYERAGDTGPVQTLTTTFRMANVDRARRASIDTKTLHGLMADAATGGGYDLPRREGSDHITPIHGVTATIMTRLPSYENHTDGTVVNARVPDFLTNAEMDGRRQALEYVRFLRDRAPGYEAAQLIALGTQIGVRETRRVYGDYRLTAEDVLGAVSFDDQIGLCGAPIEDHHEGSDTRWHYLPDGATVGIPYRSLVVRDSGNVLVAGRCFSATHDAHASVRSMAQCIAMGQAAGAAAAMAVADGVSAREVDVHRLQSALAHWGAIIESDDAVVSP